jgi:hypothetical protein
VCRWLRSSCDGRSVELSINQSFPGCGDSEPAQLIDDECTAHRWCDEREQALSAFREIAAHHKTAISSGSLRGLRKAKRAGRWLPLAPCQMWRCRGPSVLGRDNAPCRSRSALQGAEMAASAEYLPRSDGGVPLKNQTIALLRTNQVSGLQREMPLEPVLVALSRVPPDRDTQGW